MDETESLFGHGHDRGMETPACPARTAAPPDSIRHMRRQLAQGFSLVEMLAVMAIGSLLITMAVQSLQPLIQSAQLTAASNTFVSTLHLARSEAIKRNARVVLCKTADGIACTGEGSWEQGWIVFHDANNNGLRESTETIVHRQQPLSARLVLRGNANLAAYVSFAASGATKLVGGGFQAGTLTLCHQMLERREARQIILNAAGRPRVRNSTLESCV
jgi:type IV fimbrial biogenesis protein FimT